MFIKPEKSSDEMRHPARSILYSDISKEAEHTVALICEKNEKISTQRKSLWPPTYTKTDKTGPIAILTGNRSDTNLCTAHS